MFDKQYPLTQVSNDLPRFIGLVENGHVVEITRHDNVVAVLVSPQDYYQLKRLPQRNVWEAIQAFRQTLDPADLEPDEELFKAVRDPSSAREEVIW